MAYTSRPPGLSRRLAAARIRRCFAASYEVVIMPGGHFMHREHPDVFERELLRVIAR